MQKATNSYKKTNTNRWLRTIQTSEDALQQDIKMPKKKGKNKRSKVRAKPKARKRGNTEAALKRQIMKSAARTRAARNRKKK